MPGDVSRSTFSQPRHYRAVRKQQGRVDLDADWNEQADITSHRFDAEALDLVGRSGVPKDNAGFGVSVPNNVPVISAGRAYVDGILCENEQTALALTAQPDLPNFALPATAGRYLVYLDVWEREITALDDPNIREIALGGADTCTRSKTVWQVKLLQADKAGGQFGCGNPLAAFDNLSIASTGKLVAQATPTQTSSDPCIIAPSAGYTGLDNQLYRVEIFAGGPAAQSTFTWARDDASTVVAWNAQNGNDLTVTASNAATFASGQWIELTDDTHVLSGVRGVLVRLVAVSGSTLTIDPTTAIASTATSAPTTASAPATATVTVDIKNFPLNAKVIGWNSAGAVALAAGTLVTLENGLQVEFSNGASSYRAGDYWLIPARSGVGVLWPLDATNAPLARSPHGIAHHYARLAIVDFDLIKWSFIQDCRQVFPPLTELPTGGAGATDALEVREVLLGSTGAALANDSSVSVNALLGGFQIVCDRPPEPLSIKPPTFYVTLALPFPSDAAQAQLWGKGLAGSVPLTIDAQVAANGTAITWTPTQNAAQFLQTFFQGLGQLGLFSGSVLARVTVEGKFVWLQGNPGVHLDGTVYGTPAASNASINAALPSGDSRRGGDFKMWFWLTPAASVLVSLTFNPPSTTANPSTLSTGALTLSGAAPAGGVTVKLSAIVTDPTHPSSAGIAGAINFPSSVFIQAGATSATFQVVPTLVTYSPGFDPATVAAATAALTRTVTMTATSSVGSVIGTLTLTPHRSSG